MLLILRAVVARSSLKYDGFQFVGFGSWVLLCPLVDGFASCVIVEMFV